MLDPLFAQLEEASRLELDREVLAAMVLRMHLSVVIVPPEERWLASPGILADWLAALLQARVPARKRLRASCW